MVRLVVVGLVVAMAAGALLSSIKEEKGHGASQEHIPIKPISQDHRQQTKFLKPTEKKRKFGLFSALGKVIGELADVSKTGDPF